MRKGLLIFFTLLYAFTNAQVRIGLQGGYNSAHISPRHSSSVIFRNESSSISYDYTTSSFRGFQAGAVAELTLAHDWFLRSGLLVDGKGTRLKKIGFSDTSTRFIELLYIEVPVSLVHNWKIGERLDAFGGVGLYAARAFRGVEKGEGNTPGISYYLYNRVKFTSRNEENGSVPTRIIPIDYGATAIAGLEWQRIQLLVSYFQGFQRVFPKSLIFQEKYTNRVLGFSAVYLFNIKRK
ncbi:outer membrane beta-barrel protein [Segetibacter aerophilus]|uniref:Outer membrane protein beta-barrel domain-containing protein n=1 Tax=Segetibacter aerophilus TaxID=670293 RepID=A0A512BB96_9BACT|nr:outer membrane beta-barrel protein [Segetibacter aerophilus]GEO09244.1 hypothetical protein SAE01_17400 [Segetibacter aerophilus]